MKGVRKWRAVHRSICQSRKVNRLGVMGALLYERMLLWADDEGRLEADPVDIKTVCVPSLDEFTIPVIEKLLDQMTRKPTDLIQLYQADGFQYAWIFQFRESQSTHGTKLIPSVIPCPPPMVDKTTTVGGHDHHIQDRTGQEQDTPPKAPPGGDIEIADWLIRAYRFGVRKGGDAGKARERILAKLKKGMADGDGRRLKPAEVPTALAVATKNAAAWYAANGSEPKHRKLLPTFFNDDWRDGRWYPDLEAPHGRSASPQRPDSPSRRSDRVVNFGP